MAWVIAGLIAVVGILSVLVATKSYKLESALTQLEAEKIKNERLNNEMESLNATVQKIKEQRKTYTQVQIPNDNDVDSIVSGLNSLCGNNTES